MFFVSFLVAERDNIYSGVIVKVTKRKKEKGKEHQNKKE